MALAGVSKSVLSSLLRYTCPLYARARGSQLVEQVGSAVPFAAGGRLFLLTAGHVIDDHGRKPLLYPSATADGAPSKLSDQVVELFRNDTPEGSEADLVDSGIIEIPAGALHPFYLPVPHYMLTMTPTLKHVSEVTLVGYPTTKNKVRRGVGSATPRGIAFTGGHAQAEYSQLGLSPVAHFCVRFNPERAEVDGVVRTPPSFHGMSGGAAWSVPESAIRSGSDEGAMLLGLTAQSPPRRTPRERNVIWGPRVYYIVGLLIRTFPDLAPYLKRPPGYVTTDPEVVRDFREAQRGI